MFRAKDTFGVMTKRGLRIVRAGAVLPGDHECVKGFEYRYDEVVEREQDAPKPKPRRKPGPKPKPAGDED